MKNYIRLNLILIYLSSPLKFKKEGLDLFNKLDYNYKINFESYVDFKFEHEKIAENRTRTELELN